MRKPAACQGCAMYGDGEGFCPDEVPATGATIIFIAQNPGETEEFQARPLIGVSGQVLRQQFVARYLPDAKVGYANVLKCRARTKTGSHTNALPKPGSRLWQQVVAHCKPYLDASLAVAPEALRVPMGDHAIQAITGLHAKKVLHLRGTWLP